MHSYVKDVQKETGCKEVELKETQQGDFRFQLEIPDKVKVDLDDYILQKKLKGRSRYVSQPLQDLTEELQDAEEKLHDSLKPFIRGMFRKFYQYRNILSNAVGCIGELDCLCALADVSADDSKGPMCKPEILDRSDDE